MVRRGVHPGPRGRAARRAGVAAWLLAGAAACDWSLPPPRDATVVDVPATDDTPVDAVDDLATPDDARDVATVDARDAGNLDAADARDAGDLDAVEAAVDTGPAGPATAATDRCASADAGVLCPTRGTLAPQIRVAHFATGLGGGVDFCVRLAGEPDLAFRGPFMRSMTPSAAALAFGDVSTYRNAIDGAPVARALVVRVVPGTAVDCRARVAALAQDYDVGTLQPGESATLAFVGDAAAGPDAGGTTPRVARLLDTRFIDPMENPVIRVVHAAPSLGAIDVVVRNFTGLPPFAPVWLNVTYLTLGRINPFVMSAFQTDCNCYSRLPAGNITVNVTIVPTGMMTELVSPPASVMLAFGDLRSGFIIGRSGVASGPERLQLRFCDDAVGATGPLAACQVFP